ncbi:HNH endonuclease [Gordonia phage Evaa]|nr:HNH endonuclease [Gordonia phage Evaa]
MPEPERWEPDDHLVAAAIGGTRTMADLEPADRSWAVAGMTQAGLTAQDIADRMGCSLRLVKSIRAEPMTQVCALLMRETESFDLELRMVSSELRLKTTEHQALVLDYDRVKAERDRLIDAHITGGVDTCSRGHAMTAYNTYSSHGRRYCRECHRDRQARYRAARKAVGTGPVSTM